MNKMTCREKILSQDYWDFILPGDRGKMADNIPENSYCRQQMDFGYESVSVDKSLLSPLNIEEYCIISFRTVIHFWTVQEQIMMH